jgi:hypothetical protein
MALIPPDAGVRMRMQTETNLLQPATPVRELPTKLDDLRPGQNFTARIQEVLPDNSYKALVAGKQITLQLPEGAKANDVLDLVVVDRSGKAIIAKQVDSGNANAATAPYAFAKFSPAARLIGQLLPADGQAAPPARLNGGQPLLAQPPGSAQAAAQLAPTLARAVTQSGLFYEAHQAQWVTGKMPLTQLLQEPQGQRSAPSAFVQATTEAITKANAEMAGRAPQPAGPTEQRTVTAGNILQTLQAGAEKAGAGTGTMPGVGAGETAAKPAQGAHLAQQVPDAVRPLVQQQLDAVASHRLVWQGEVWPQQPMQWEIEWQNERDADGSEEESLHWQTSLSLTTPRLGRVDANLQLTAEGVRIRLATPYGASAGDMRDAAPRLAEALAAAGVPLLAFQVRHESEVEGA